MLPFRVLLVYHVFPINCWCIVCFLSWHWSLNVVNYIHWPVHAVMSYIISFSVKRKPVAKIRETMTSHTDKGSPPPQPPYVMSLKAIYLPKGKGLFLRVWSSCSSLVSRSHMHLGAIMMPGFCFCNWRNIYEKRIILIYQSMWYDSLISVCRAICVQVYTLSDLNKYTSNFLLRLYRYSNFVEGAMLLRYIGHGRNWWKPVKR